MPPSPLVHSASPQRRRAAIGAGRPAFTMIELLTVIAIITLISGILVLGLTSVAHSRKVDQTVAMLKRLDNAMTELTTSQAGAFKMYSIQLPNIYFPPDANGSYTASAYANWIGVPSTALESQLRTALVLDRVVATNPSAKQFLADLPPERRKLISWTLATPGSTLLTPAGKSKPEYLMPLDAWGNPILFVFDGLIIPTGPNVGRPFTVQAGGTNETYVGGLTNLIVDADKSYYEPITALTPVPTVSSGANTDMPNTSSAYDRATNGKYTNYNPHQSVTTPVVREECYRSPDHKPYWVSAGPDGRYDTHDDNVYSFGH